LDIDRIAVGLTARHVFGRNVAHRARLVLDNDVATDDGPQLLRVEAHENVSAAAGRVSADEAHVLARVSLRRSRGRQGDKLKHRAGRDHIPETQRRPPDHYSLAYRAAHLSLIAAVCAAYPCGSSLPMRMYSAQDFSSRRSFSCACSGVMMKGSLAKPLRNVLVSSLAVTWSNHLLSLSMIGTGVAAGTIAAHHRLMLAPGIPASIIVGKSGAALSRRSLDTASTRSLPCRC